MPRPESLELAAKLTAETGVKFMSTIGYSRERYPRTWDLHSHWENPPALQHAYLHCVESRLKAEFTYLSSVLLVTRCSCKHTTLKTNVITSVTHKNAVAHCKHKIGHCPLAEYRGKEEG